MQSRVNKLLELLETQGSGLFTLLTRLTMSEDIAEDLMQELFIKLSKSKALDKAANPVAYIRRAAINLAFDRQRTLKLKTSSLDAICEPASSENSPPDELIRAEELTAILDAVSRLQGASRHAFVMRYIQQEPYDYIAEQLDKTPHQIRALCSKALTRLRDLLGTDKTSTFQKEVHNAED